MEVVWWRWFSFSIRWIFRFQPFIFWCLGIISGLLLFQIHVSTSQEIFRRFDSQPIFPGFLAPQILVRLEQIQPNLGHVKISGRFPQNPRWRCSWGDLSTRHLVWVVAFVMVVFGPDVPTAKYGQTHCKSWDFLMISFTNWWNMILECHQFIPDWIPACLTYCYIFFLEGDFRKGIFGQCLRKPTAAEVTLEKSHDLSTECEILRSGQGKSQHFWLMYIYIYIWYPPPKTHTFSEFTGICAILLLFTMFKCLFFFGVYFIFSKSCVEP